MDIFSALAVNTGLLSLNDVTIEGTSKFTTVSQQAPTLDPTPASGAQYKTIEDAWEDLIPKQCVDVEANFDIRLFARLDKFLSGLEYLPALDKKSQSAGQADKLFRELIESSRYHIFPTQSADAISELPTDVVVLARTSGNINASIFSAGESWLKQVNDENIDFVGTLKRTRVEWTKSLSHLLERFLMTSEDPTGVDKFYVVPSIRNDRNTGENAMDENNGKITYKTDLSFKGSVIFFHESGSKRNVFALLTGATSRLLARLDELGVTPDNMLHIKDTSTETLERIQQLNRLSMFGSSQITKSGKVVLLRGEFQIRVCVQVLNEIVMFGSAAARTNKLAVSVPLLVCPSSPFRHSAAKHIRVTSQHYQQRGGVSFGSTGTDRAVSQTQTAEASAGPATLHRVQLSGFICSATISKLAALLIALSCGDEANGMHTPPLAYQSNHLRQPIPDEFLVPITSHKIAGKRSRDVGGVDAASLNSRQGGLFRTNSIPGLNATVSAELKAPMTFFTTKPRANMITTSFDISKRGGSLKSMSRKASISSVSSSLEVEHHSNGGVLEDDLGCANGGHDKQKPDRGCADDIDEHNLSDWIGSRRKLAPIHSVGPSEKHFVVRCTPISCLTNNAYLNAILDSLEKPGGAGVTDAHHKRKEQSTSETCLEAESSSTATNAIVDQWESIQRDHVSLAAAAPFFADATKDVKKSVLSSSIVSSIVWRQEYRTGPDKIAYYRVFDDRMTPAMLCSLLEGSEFAAMDDETL